jgi:hypothetical protein
MKIKLYNDKYLMSFCLIFMGGKHDNPTTEIHVT